MSRLKLNKQIITVQAVLVMLFTVGVIQAQDAVTRWDLNNCISYALEKNLTVNKARLDILSGEADLMQARGQRLPNLSGSVSQTLAGDISPWEMNYSGSLSVTSAVTIYNGGLINNDIERSAKAQELNKLDLEQASNNIILSVTQAYLNALYAKENIDYYTQVLTSSKRQVERATALKKAGSMAYRDVADIEAQFASDRYALVNASNELVLRITTLKQILEIPVEDSFELYFPEEGVKESLDPLPTRADAFESALN
ncbi:MAG: TolC family protein, partial [Prolixibacteraceae bacterium]|nr:TolC family protein [Prolixibacteraceae bacterium]